MRGILSVVALGEKPNNQHLHTERRSRRQKEEKEKKENNACLVAQVPDMGFCATAESVWRNISLHASQTSIRHSMNSA